MSRRMLCGFCLLYYHVQYYLVERRPMFVIRKKQNKKKCVALKNNTIVFILLASDPKYCKFTFKFVQSKVHCAFGVFSFSSSSFNICTAFKNYIAICVKNIKKETKIKSSISFSHSFFVMLLPKLLKCMRISHFSINCMKFHMRTLKTQETETRQSH